VGVPGFGVHGGDDPVPGDPLRDPPPPTTSTVVDPFDVLTGQQRQQCQRLTGLIGFALPVGALPVGALPSDGASFVGSAVTWSVSVLVNASSRANASSTRPSINTALAALSSHAISGLPGRV